MIKSGAGVIFVFILVLSMPIFPIEEVVTRYTTEPYTFEQQLLHEKQAPQIPWFWNEVTQTQYKVTNTDISDGTFTINYFFDNGSESKTKTNRVKILAGEAKSLTMNSPLTGTSNVSLNIVPPYRTVPKQEIITRNVNIWHFIGNLKISIW